MRKKEKVSHFFKKVKISSMRLLKKRETLIQNIAYMGIMAAVNIIFVVMTYFVPFLLFVLVFVLPLCSAIISFYCKKIYFPIYFIVVTAVCLLIDFSDALFYVIPSLLTGFIFGFLIEKEVPSIFIIITITIIQFALSLASIPLIELITNRNLVDDMAALFKLSDYIYLDYVKFTFIFFIAFTQTILTYLVMRSELIKFGMAFNEAIERTIILDVISIGLVGLSVLFGFLVPEICFIFLFMSFIFMVYRIIKIDFTHYRLYLIELIIILLVTVFFVACLYSLITKPLGLLLFGILPLLVSSACIINFCLLSKRNKDTINK